MSESEKPKTEDFRFAGFMIATLVVCCLLGFAIIELRIEVENAKTEMVRLQLRLDSLQTIEPCLDNEGKMTPGFLCAERRK